MNIANIKSFFCISSLFFASITFAQPPQNNEYVHSVDGTPKYTVTAGWSEKTEEKAEQTDKPDEEDEKETEGAIAQPPPSLVQIWTVQNPDPELSGEPPEKTDDIKEPEVYAQKKEEIQLDPIPIQLPLLVDAFGNEFINLDALIQNVFAMDENTELDGNLAGEEGVDGLSMLANLFTSVKDKDRKAIIPFSIGSVHGPMGAPLKVTITEAMMLDDQTLKLTIGMDKEGAGYTGHIIYHTNGVIYELEIFFDGKQYTFRKIIPAPSTDVDNEVEELEKEARDDTVMKFNDDSRDEDDDDDTRKGGPSTHKRQPSISQHPAHSTHGSDKPDSTETSSEKKETPPETDSQTTGQQENFRKILNKENTTLQAPVIKEQVEFTSSQEAHEWMGNIFKEQSVH